MLNTLIYVTDAIFWIVLFIHMKVTGLLFKMSIFGPNTGGIFYMTFFKISGNCSCLYISSGNAIFFLKELFLDLLISSDTELSMELFTEPIAINITL